MAPDVQCISKHGVVEKVLCTYWSKEVSFIVLLMRLELVVGFSRVHRVSRVSTVSIRVRYYV